MAQDQDQQVGSALRRALQVIFFTVLLLASVTETRADERRPANAQAAFDRAVDLAKDGKTCEAAAAFEESYALYEARDTLNGLALAEEECGKHVDAYNHFATLEEQAATAGDDRRATLASRALERLAPKVGLLSVRAPKGVVLTIDGAAHEAKRPIAVAPGSHRVTITRGDRTADETVDVAIGTTKEVTLSLPAEHEPSESSFALGPLGVVGIAVAAVGVLGVISGSVLYASAGSQFDDVASRCPNNVCPSDAQQDIDAGRQEEVAGQVLLGIGITALLAGAGLVTWSLLSAEEGAVARVEIGPTGVALSGRF